MVHIKRSMGFIQLFFGLFLVISSFFIMSFGINFYANHVSSFEWGWQSVFEENNLRLDAKDYYFATSVLAQGAYNILYTTTAFAILTLILGIFMATQGIANTIHGHKDDPEVHHIGHAVWIGTIVMLVMVFILYWFTKFMLENVLA